MHTLIPGFCIPHDLVPIPASSMTLSVVPELRRGQPHDGPWSLHGMSVSQNSFLFFQLMWAAKLGPAVGLLKLPRYRELVMPGTVCSVAGWGRLGVNSPSATTLRETDVEVQRDEQCSGRFKYNSTIQICAGSPTKMNNSFLVRFPSIMQAKSWAQPSCEDLGQWAVS